MAEIQTSTVKKKTGIKYLPKKKLFVDLTPMVDLGFLLITFFILTTSLTMPSISKLVMPKDSKADMPVSESCALTLLPAGNNEIYYYEGISAGNTLFHKTNFSENGGLRELIENKQQKIFSIKGTKDAMVVIIKPGKESSYKNMIDILDEMKISDVAHYIIVDEDAMDRKLLGE
jgi:biopolymer transport protein ExbD